RVTTRGVAVLVAVLGWLAYVVPVAVTVVGSHLGSVTFTAALLWDCLGALAVMLVGALGVVSALLGRPLLGWMVAFAFAALAVREPIWWFFLMPVAYALAALPTTFGQRGRRPNLFRL
ncbi:MAG: hypothetical protein M1337_00925, partial [Actinobacteria bacterium]|nr:hypothetical protein [Actinomycetota bacterium]